MCLQCNRWEIPQTKQRNHISFCVHIRVHCMNYKIDDDLWLGYMIHLLCSSSDGVVHIRYIHSRTIKFPKNITGPWAKFKWSLRTTITISDNHCSWIVVMVGSLGFAELCHGHWAVFSNSERVYGEPKIYFHLSTLVSDDSDVVRRSFQSCWSPTPGAIGSRIDSSVVPI